MSEEIIIEKQKPQITKIILAVLISAIVFGLIGYVFGKKTNSATPSAPTAETAVIEQSVAATSSPVASAAADETANWRTYSNDTYGFSFKYPNTWVQYDLEANAGEDAAIYFKNPEVKPTTEGDNADPYAIQNIFVRIYSKNDNTKLPDWLTAKFRGMGGELVDYNIGEQIKMGGMNGYVSDIGCCGGRDKSYVVENNGHVFGLGTFSSEKYTMLAEISRTFQFTK